MVTAGVRKGGHTTFRVLVWPKRWFGVVSMVLAVDPEVLDLGISVGVDVGDGVVGDLA